jgi:hypothetical protein
MQAVSKSHADFISLLIVFIFCNVAGKTTGDYFTVFSKKSPWRDLTGRCLSDNNAIKIPDILGFSIPEFLKFCAHYA